MKGWKEMKGGKEEESGRVREWESGRVGEGENTRKLTI